MRHLRLTRPRMKGSDVRLCQKKLMDKVAGRHFVYHSGVFDEQTVSAIMVLQRYNNLQPTGVVDDMTWNVLFNKSSIKPVTSHGQRKKFLSACHSLINTPYIHGSSNPQLGLDSLGFLSCAASRAEQLALKDDITLVEFVQPYDHIPESEAEPGDLVVYLRQDGRPNHLMVLLNAYAAIGAVGGNTFTTNLKLAAKRDACVKIKHPHYRPDKFFIKNPLIDGSDS